MNCPCCGAQLPEGITFCANCGNDAVTYNAQQNKQTDVSSNLFSVPIQSAGYSDYSTSKSKSNNGMIAGIIAFVVVVALIVAGLFGFTNIRYMGEYKIESFEVSGITMNMDQMDLLISQYGSMLSDTERENIEKLKTTKIDVGLFKGTLSMGGKTSEKAKMKIRGDKFTAEFSGYTMTGEYDKSSKTIIIDISSLPGASAGMQGARIHFKKK